MLVDKLLSPAEPWMCGYVQASQAPHPMSQPVPSASSHPGQTLTRKANNLAAPDREGTAAPPGKQAVSCSGMLCPPGPCHPCTPNRQAAGDKVAQVSEGPHLPTVFSLKAT